MCYVMIVLYAVSAALLRRLEKKKALLTHSSSASSRPESEVVKTFGMGEEGGSISLLPLPNVSEIEWLKGVSPKHPNCFPSEPAACGAEVGKYRVGGVSSSCLPRTAEAA